MWKSETLSIEKTLEKNLVYAKARVFLFQSNVINFNTSHLINAYCGHQMILLFLIARSSR
jgi:hypothetical protein